MPVRVPSRERAGGKTDLCLGAAARHQNRRDEPQDWRREMVPGRGVLHLSFPQCVRGERFVDCRRMPDEVARDGYRFVRRQTATDLAMESELEGRLDEAAPDR